MTFLVFVNHENIDGNNVLSYSSQKILSKIISHVDNVVAVNVDDVCDEFTLQKIGVSEVYNCSIPEEYKGLGNSISKVFLKILNDLSNVCGIFLPSTFIGKEVAAILGAKLSTVAVTDVEDFVFTDNEINLKKKVLNSAWTSGVKINNSFCIATFKDDNDVVENPSDSLNVKQLEVDFSCEDNNVKVLSSKISQNSNIDLENAPIVVCGGRGTNGDFTPVYDLAENLGGVVGATRVATDEGWVDRALQIGQTGHNLNAKLYIGLGVSGAVHHTCSLQNCETIVAICDDEDAPIFEIADFGIIGDLNSVVPALIEELGK